MAFNLTIPWVLERLRIPCQKTGFAYRILDKSRNMKDRHPMSPSLDKINPARGYTKANTQVVSWWYNCAKQRFTDSQVLELCQAVVTTAKARS